MKTEPNDDWNERSLVAWNQWKAICSILGCKPEDQRILVSEVARAFYIKLRSVIGSKELNALLANKYHTVDSKDEEDNPQETFPSLSGRLPSDSQFYSDECENEQESSLDTPMAEDQDSEGSIKQNSPMPNDAEEECVTCETRTTADSPYDYRMVWAHEFDCGIIEKTNSPKSPKNYKDHTWECIRHSDDPPLKIIRGQLLGPRGIINEIAERFLRNNYPQLWEKGVSIQDPLYTNTNSDDDEPTTLEATIPDLPKPRLDYSDEECLTNSLQHLFSLDNAAIFLVYLTDFSKMFSRKISLATPELQHYLGFSSISPIYDRLNNIIIPKLQALPSEFRQSMHAPGACDFVIFMIINQLKTEKRAVTLLQKIETEMMNS